MSESITDKQWEIFTKISRTTASVSILASAAIVFKIVKGRKNTLGFVHNRLILMMSILDIIQSMAMDISTAAFPKETNIYGAAGNQSTCIAQGFFTVFAAPAVIFYNSMLCICFMASVRYNVSDELIAKREPFMHAICLLIPLAQGIIAVSTKVVHSNDLGSCFIADICLHSNDPDCKNENEKILNAMFMTYALEILITFIIELVSLVLLYLSVREKGKNVKKFRILNRNDSYIGRNERSYETGVQSLLYIGSYLLTFIWPMIILFNRLVSPAETHIFVRLCVQVFYPLQGFWNFLIYVRPRYKAVRLQNMDKSFLWVLKTIFLGNPLNPLKRNAVKVRERIRRSIVRVPRGMGSVLDMEIPSDFDLDEEIVDVVGEENDSGRLRDDINTEDKDIFIVKENDHAVDEGAEFDSDLCLS